MQANIEYIQKDNILNKFLYFTDDEDEQRYSKYYLQQHYKMMYLVYFTVFGVNVSVFAKIILESGFEDITLIPIFVNQLLVLIMALCIKRQKSYYNKLSCLINIIFAIEVFYYQKRFKSNDLNDYYQLCGFIIYGSHNSLMLSSQILYDSLGLLINFVIYSYQLQKSDRVIELLLMWCIIIISIYQKLQHHKFTRFLYVSMQHQQEWIDVIENVLPSAIISIQQGKQNNKNQHSNFTKSDILHNTQLNIQNPQEKTFNNSNLIKSLNSNSQKQQQPKGQHQNQGQNAYIPNQSLPNGIGVGVSEGQGQPAAENESEDNLFKEWNLNLVNGQSKESYSIKDMDSFVTFAHSVLIDTKELMMETSTAVNGNITSPLHPLDVIHKQLEFSNTTNNQINFTINPHNNNLQNNKPNDNTTNQVYSNNNISNQQQHPLFANVNPHGTSLQVSPARYSLKGHTQNIIQELSALKAQKNIRKNDKINTLAFTENYLNNQGQLCSGVMSLQADGGSPYVTLYRQLQILVEDYTSNNKKNKFFIWKLNGKYYPPQQKTNEQHSIIKDKSTEKSHMKERSVVSIQIKVCGFRGKQTRIVLCIDDISISEKIQLYQSQDKYKDLVLANAAHDLRQPLNALNYTILETKKLLKKFQNQNIYSFLYQYYPQQYQMLAQVNPLLGSIIPNVMATSKINATDIIVQQIQSNHQLLNVKATMAQDCTQLQMIMELLEMADISGSSLKYLINDILDHAKLKEGKLQVNFKECLLSQIIQFTKKMFDFSFKEKGIKYRIINQAELSSDQICTDQQRLQQVLVNLLSNSLKFTPSDKYIILHISKVIKHVHNREVSLLKISVIDQGCGMSTEQLQQIFKPYVSFNNNNLNIEGIGLGLNICKSIIGLLGPYPKLYVRSKQNEGTKFFFYIYHQLRKGSTTQRAGQNKTWSKLPNIPKVPAVNGGTKNEIESRKKDVELKSPHTNVTSLHKGVETDQDQITTKGLIGMKEQSKKHSDSFELNELNEVVEKKRVLSIIDHTSRSHTHNDLSDNQIQMNNSLNRITEQKKTIILNNIEFDEQTSHRNKDGFNSKEKETTKRNTLEHITKSLESEDSEINHEIDEDVNNEEEDEDKNSNLNMTSIIMQLPDLNEEQTEQEMQSPLSKHSRRNLLYKYSQPGQLMNPISTLNSYRATYYKPTPRSADNLTFLENTFSQQNRSYFNDDTSVQPLHSNDHFRDIGEIFYQQSKRNNSQENNTQQAHNISFNNVQHSESFLLNRQASQGGVNVKTQQNGILKQSQMNPSSNSFQGLPFSGQFYPPQTTSNTNMSLYSFSNQYQIKQSQFMNNLKDENQNGIHNHNQVKPYPNSIDSLFSTKAQSKPNHINSVFMPVASSQLINNSNNNPNLYSTKAGSRSKISRPPTIVSNNSSSTTNNTQINNKQRKQVKNLPAILTQFQKKYPNALNEMDQSTGSFIMNNQKEELQVIIADDDPFNISILKMMLKKSDQFTFQVKDCNNGMESLIEFQKRNKPQSQKPISLVISDINMPIMDGIQSTKQMRKAISEQNFHQAVFIGVSGIDEETIANDPSLQADFKVFDVVFTKPLNEQAVINAINQNFLDFY